MRGLFVFAALFLSVPVQAAPTVVIDPGHGGAHLGAKNVDGVAEKVIALAISKHAKRALRRRGMRVVLTRGDDRTLALGARVRMANAEGAAAYVSIHANYAPVPQRRGIETYILSAQASDSDAATTVHLENEGDLSGRFVEEDAFGGGVADRQAGPLDFILADLERMKSHKDSALLARGIQDQCGGIKGLRPSRGLRQAPFAVLKGASMPAVLVEVGYLSSPAQGRYLATPAAHKATGEAIARGIAWFLRQKRR